ncbi:ribosome biogenesis GTPase [Lachnospiraceae bacterium NK3A20]|nr:ribosome biogenesis GTPase [Lachnospiraceae bacterium NK3A20]
MPLKGKIIKSISGFYEVYTDSSMNTEADMTGAGGIVCDAAGLVYRCRAKGVLRALHQKPLVGDDVLFDVTDTAAVPPEGNVVSLLPRRNELVRPYVANVDQACLLFAITNPAPSYNMLDRFLISMKIKGLPAVLCFNKLDLASEERIRELREVYEQCGCRVLFISTKDPDSLEELRRILRGKTSVITGPSGAGKSSLINRLIPGSRRETGELSRKIARGRNTTRTVELLAAGNDTYLVDTPGFTSLYLQDIEAEDVKAYYPEFVRVQEQCRFQGCNHLAEPGCAVKAALRDGEISCIRYQNYTEIFAELKDRKPIYRKRDLSKPEFAKKR